MKQTITRSGRKTCEVKNCKQKQSSAFLIKNISTTLPPPQRSNGPHQTLKICHSIDCHPCSYYLKLSFCIKETFKQMIAAENIKERVLISMGFNNNGCDWSFLFLTENISPRLLNFPLSKTPYSIF